MLFYEPKNKKTKSIKTVNVLKHYRRSVQVVTARTVLTVVDCLAIVSDCDNW